MTHLLQSSSISHYLSEVPPCGRVFETRRYFTAKLLLWIQTQTLKEGLNRDACV